MGDDSMHEWSDSGYDLRRCDRWLYAFASTSNRRVKIGMVLNEERLVPRLSEVRRKSGLDDLREVWRGRLLNMTHEELEHVEAAVRYWLVTRADFEFVALVDWLGIPAEFDESGWVAQLDRAVVEVGVFAAWPAGRHLPAATDPGR